MSCSTAWARATLLGCRDSSPPTSRTWRTTAKPDEKIRKAPAWLRFAQDPNPMADAEDGQRRRAEDEGEANVGLGREGIKAPFSVEQRRS
jgi:hypothetical protein